MVWDDAPECELGQASDGDLHRNPSDLWIMHLFSLIE